MRKIFHFESPRERYRCDAAVVWCFDNRFDLAFRKFLKRLGVLNPDPIKVAGGAKALAASDCESDRDFVIDQIRKSIELHATSRVILMVHSDCGAYGTLEGGFGGDARAEARHMRSELRKAADCVRRMLPGIEVQGYFADFEGIWEPTAEEMAVGA